MSGLKGIIPFFILILLFFRGVTTVAQSQNPIILTDIQDQYPLSLHLEILEDKSGILTIDDVTSPEVAVQFRPSLEENPRFGFTDSAYWVRLQVENEASSDIDWLLEYDSIAFHVEYYFPAAEGEGFEVIRTGAALPFDTRDVPVGQFVFQLPINPQESKTVYMRLASDGSLILPLTILSESEFAQQAIRQQVFNGILYGILLILSIYNLVLFFSLRDSSYLYYVLFFGAILLGIMSLDGFAAQYLWPNLGSFAAISTRLFVVMSYGFALLFTTSFLRTKEYAPRLHQVMIALVIAIFILLGPMFFWFMVTAVLHVALMFVSNFIMLAVGVLVWRRGYYPARHFLLGWLVVFIGFMILALTLADVGLLMDMSATVLRLGLIILALILSIGLTERINFYRNEMAAAQIATITQRTRIAQDLHDSVTQSLYSANLFSEAGRGKVKAGDLEGANHYFDRVRSMTHQALKEMRLFLYELRPPDVVEEGLIDALQKRLDTVEKRAGLEADLLIDGNINFPDQVNDQFYRISQEALNNVIKHGGADEVTVNLRGFDGIMELEIIDNGRGFILAEARKNGGQGLKTMQERATDINGHLTIKSTPNQGTIVKVKARQ